MTFAHNVSQPLHFRPFLAKTNDSILHKGPKTLFLGHFGPFSPFLRKWEFFWKMVSGAVYTLLPSNFMKNMKKIEWDNFEKYTKKLFFPTVPPTFGPFCPKSREREFSQIWDLHRKLANHKTLHFRTFTPFFYKHTVNLAEPQYA